jgi:hypothetical protein
MGFRTAFPRLPELILVSILIAVSGSSFEDPEEYALYATNAVSVGECTLHTLDPERGNVLKDIGSVQAADGTLMGIFGMCFLNNRLYGVNAMDELVTINAETAVATVVGSVGVNGLYDLACSPHGQHAYSYDAQDGRIVLISLDSGKGTILEAQLEQSDAVSMDFDQIGDLWLLQDGKFLSKIDIATGSQSHKSVLSGASVNQRHGSYKPDSGTLYSAFFEPNPSTIWKVDLASARVLGAFATGLSNAYTLAFLDLQVSRTQSDSA